MENHENKCRRSGHFDKKVRRIVSLLRQWPAREENGTRSRNDENAKSVFSRSWSASSWTPLASAAWTTCSRLLSGLVTRVFFCLCFFHPFASFLCRGEQRGSCTPCRRHATSGLWVGEFRLRHVAVAVSDVSHSALRQRARPGHVMVSRRTGSVSALQFCVRSALWISCSSPVGPPACENAAYRRLALVRHLCRVFFRVVWTGNSKVDGGAHFCNWAACVCVVLELCPHFAQ